MISEALGINQKSKKILLINDMPGYGKVALAAMVPLLSRMGHYTYQLPTAVISNTLDYGKFRIQDMTDYMRDTLEVWTELGFDPDCICTGFVTSEEQVELIGDYLGRINRRQRIIVVDPIMADGGRLYNGIGPERIDAMRRLVGYSSVMTPNMTEAGFLTGIRPGAQAGTAAEIRELVDGLQKLSKKSVVITSVMESESGAHLVCGFDSYNGEYFKVPYEYLPVRVAGSGDIFSAIMTGELLAGKSLRSSVEKAVHALNRLIAANQAGGQKYKGIMVEQYWDILEEVDKE